MRARSLLFAVGTAMVLVSVSTSDAGEQNSAADAAHKAALARLGSGATSAHDPTAEGRTECVSGNRINVHELEAVDRRHIFNAGTTLRVRLTAVNNFGAPPSDPTAMLIGVQLGADAVSSITSGLSGFNYRTCSPTEFRNTWCNDDGPGGLAPELSIITPFTGTYLLLVSAFSNAATACYTYQVIP